MNDNHDPMCTSDVIWQLRTKPCPVCALIAKARADERRDIAIQARNAILSPTLQTKKILAIIEQAQ